MTGRFGPPSQKRITAYRLRLRAQRRNRLNALASLIAEGWTVQAASRHLGFTQQTGSSLFRQMRDELGEQAV